MITTLILITLGILIGWIYSRLMSTDYRYGLFTDILLSVSGGLVGNLLVDILLHFTILSFTAINIFGAIIGAIILLMLGRIFLNKL